MHYPDFFASIPTITLRDPLAALLGVEAEGRLVYSYLDAVKWAGHSCPTVVGAYLMTLRGLDALYGSETPVRGSIEVTLRGTRESGVTGVMAGVIGMITGAAGSEGFKGMEGHHIRANLLRFESNLDATVVMQRQDTARAVALDIDMTQANLKPMPAALKQAALMGEKAAMASFGTLWQENVARLFQASIQHDIVGARYL
jgi:hypothetical protein